VPNPDHMNLQGVSESKILTMLFPLDGITQVRVSKSGIDIAMSQYGLNASQITPFGDHQCRTRMPREAMDCASFATQLFI
jgi:hypothetical protein